MQKKTKKSIITSLISQIIRILPYSLRLGMLNIFRHTEGKKGIIIRGAIVKTLAKQCGDDISIFPNVYLGHINKIIFGNRISIHRMSYIDGAGELTIGDDVSIAHGVTIMTTEHKYENINKPIREQGIIYKKTYVDSNVWIGAKATILAGNTISTGTIIGANTVVTKEFESNAIVVGSAGKVLKIRE